MMMLCPKMSLCWGGSQVSSQWLNMPLQGQHLWQEVLSLTFKAAFHDHNGDMDGLCDAIIRTITEHRLSNNLLKANKV
ncbi:hypothetical protein M404DRAFT_778297 [Pisolithus tinctorius Marx 270]|uniref:Uncharacterized protein n=1 Tax=Pisolithus tinctorius Marx 270 TaxID=870435 RepID=A0A0C3NXF6_PISTI|nr:hypothetical protein M404DRAFT_778297 [Pisolithus tinctorius Marx 270]